MGKAIFNLFTRFWVKLTHSVVNSEKPTYNGEKKVINENAQSLENLTH